jgi:hypothetical protein
MSYQYRVNGQPLGHSEEKDRAIRAARKAALSITSPRGIIHVEVIDESSAEIVHRDMVLAEMIKDLDAKVLTSIGMVVPGQFKIEPEKKKIVDRPLFKVGQYIMLQDELHIITDVTDSCARACPVHKKKVLIKNKLTDKECEFTVKRKSISLSPTAENVLSKEAVEIELKKIEELEHGNSRTSSRDIRDSARDPSRKQGKSERTSTDGNGNSGPAS